MAHDSAPFVFPVSIHPVEPGESKCSKSLGHWERQSEDAEGEGGGERAWTGLSF